MIRDDAPRAGEALPARRLPATRTLPGAIHQAALPGLVFALAWLVYQVAIPFILVAWRITGDEPHYLLAAHSLAYDGDLDLANNYAARDFALFYAEPELGPHVHQRPDGAQLLSHDLGLPVLMALPYALGGRAGVMQVFALAGALLAAQMALLGWEASGKRWAGLLAGLSLAFSAPLGLYVFQIYPEMIGGLIVLWAMRQIVRTPRWIAAGQAFTHPAPLAFAFVSLALLPWLSGRYVPLVVLLAVISLWKDRAQHRRYLLIPLISTMLYLGFNYATYGSPTPSATEAGNAVGAGFGRVEAQQIGRGLLGWWLDQQRGLLIYGPVLILAIIGLPHLHRLRGLDGLLLFTPVILMWGLASIWGGFYSAWEVSARFLMVGVPLLVAGIAAGFARIRSRLFWPLAAGLITLSLCHAVLIALDPFIAFHESPVSVWERATGLALRRYLPAAGTRYLEYPSGPGGVWQAARGQVVHLHQSQAIDELSVGWYRLYAQAQVSGAQNADAVALTLDGYSAEGGHPLFHAGVRARQANPITGLIDLRASFFNPYLDRWNYPFYLDIRATGAADVRLSHLLFEPDPWPTYGLALAWSSAIALLALWFARR